MKLKVSRLMPGENRFHFQSSQNGGMKAVVQHLGKQGYAFENGLEADFKVTKLEPDYVLRGELKFGVQLVCDRCAEAFLLPVGHGFDLVYVRASKENTRGGDTGEQSKQLDISLFEGDEIDLAPVVEEQFFLSLPYRSLCQPDCKGICQQCGQNLNLGACSCKKGDSMSPFSALEKLKVE